MNIQHIINNVVGIVCDKFDANPEQLFRKSRDREVVYPRQIIYKMSNDLLGNLVSHHALGLIGKKYTGLTHSHSNVIHNIQTLQNLIESSKDERESYEDLLWKVKVKSGLVPNPSTATMEKIAELLYKELLTISQLAKAYDTSPLHIKSYLEKFKITNNG